MRIMRILSLTVAGLLTSGCLLIEEGDADVAALDAFQPLQAGREHTYCSSAPGDAPDCQQVVVSTAEYRGATWTRLQPVEFDGEGEKPDLLILYFRDAKIGQLAFIRIDEEPISYVLARVVAKDGAVRMVTPDCNNQAETPILQAARAAGAEIDEFVCGFKDVPTMLQVAAAADPTGETGNFGVVTIEP